MTDDDSSPAARRSWVLPAVVVGLLAAVLLTLVFALQPDSSGRSAHGVGDAAVQTGSDEPSSIEQVARRDGDDPLASGPVDAPVTLVVFSDYQCPFCARWNEDTLPSMMEHVDSGDLRIEWRDVNVFGAESERAAQASYAAALQGRYWDYHDALFAGGDVRPPEQLTEDALVGLADELGLDRTRFAVDINAPETLEQINRNADLGLYVGAYSTPTFILGQTPIAGAQPTEVFLDTFDDELAQSGE